MTFKNYIDTTPLEMDLYVTEYDNEPVTSEKIYKLTEASLPFLRGNCVEICWKIENEKYLTIKTKQ